jgi:hypothetical protein
MSLSSTPAPARTDTLMAPRDEVAAAGTTGLARAAGAALAGGATLWAASILAFDIDGGGTGWGDRLFNIASLFFQIGLVVLVTLQLRTAATGTGRPARFFLHAEHVLLGLAMVSTVAWILVQGEGREAGWFMALDVFWPLSMLGMAAIGVRIAIAGRWKGLARVWPVVAESWAPIVIPVSALFPALAPAVGAGHLMIGYVALGIILLRRPELTGAR